MRRTLLAALASALALTSTFALAEDQAGVSPAALNKVTTVCQNCHGRKGDSVSGTFPRLNGQQSDYIIAQLKNFRSHDRADPHAMAYMWGMAAQLDDALVADIAKYYSGQASTPRQIGGSLAAEGRAIFMNGIDSQHVPPCQACHGEHGEGAGDTPRIAGQHADYLRHQLEAFRSRLRENAIMHANTQNMTDAEIEAIVSYLGND